MKAPAPAPQHPNRDFAVLVVDHNGRPYYVPADPPQPPAPGPPNRV